MADGLRTLMRVVRLVTSAAPAVSGRLAALTLATGLLPPAHAWLAKQVVDGVTAAEPRRETLLLWATLFVLAYGVSVALEPIQRMLTSWLNDASIAAVDRSLLDAGGRMVDLHRLRSPEFAADLRHVDRTSYFLTGTLRGAAALASALIGLVGLLTLLAGLHPALPVALAALAAPHLFVVRRMQNDVYEAMRTHSRTAEEMDYCLRVATEPDAAKELRVFGAGGYFFDLYRERYARAQREVDRARLRQVGFASLLVLLDAGAVAGGLWYVATHAAGGALTTGDVALYASAMLQSPNLLGRVPFGFAMLHGAQLHGRRFFDFLAESRPGIRLPERGHALAAPSRLVRGIEVRHVSFAYGETPVLDDVSFTLAPGHVTTLVGHNGAGKSTLVALLTRLYDPSGGEILLDGRSLADYDLHSLRTRIGVAYQGFAKFGLTLHDNVAIGVGMPDAIDVDRLRVEQAAAAADVDQIAARLPRGFDTELTRQFEGGVDLSGGEWQKVALARSAMRDAALVILDEPTSALDAEAEHRLIQRFRALLAGRTALLISHRLSTVRLADHIVVLDHGRVAEQGTHAELLARRGLYADLYEKQSSRYR